MALTTSLVAYWSLNEASGTRADSLGANDLAPTNAPGSAAGILGNAATFDPALTQYLSAPDSAALSLGNIDFTVACWIYLDGAADAPAVCKGNASDCEFILRYDGLRPKFEVYSSAGFGGGATVSSSGGSLALHTWHFLVGRHDATGDAIDLSVDAGTPDSTSFAAGSYDSTAPYRVGGYPEFAQWFNGRVDEVGLWKRRLSDAEVASLYDGGAGLAYPFGAGGATQNYLFIQTVGGGLLTLAVG